MLFLDTSVQLTAPLKRKRKLSLIILSIIAFLLAVLLIFTLLSPIPASFMIRAAFTRKIAVPPDNYNELKRRVNVIKNQLYPSGYKDNTVDIYIPNDKEGPLPVVLWIHGGAFVGGNKEDVEIYATALAAEGLAVVCMNYRRAPEAKYPAPVIQTKDAYLWIKDVSNKYSFDINKFILAGDSAGAHIAAQFAAIQSNAAYADEMNFEQTVPLHTLKSVLLFCGPFDVAKINTGSNPIMNFFIGKAAQAYLGSKDWVKRFSYQTTISNHVTSDFPPTFITDGNNLSFEDHGRDLADALKKQDVSVETFFIPVSSEKAAHEYQFIMNTSSAKESFKQVTAFIKKHTEQK